MSFIILSCLPFFVFSFLPLFLVKFLNEYFILYRQMSKKHTFLRFDPKREKTLIRIKDKSSSATNLVVEYCIVLKLDIKKDEDN